MNKRQKLVQQQFLNNEEAVIKRLNQVYNKSLNDINDKIKNLTFTIDKLQQEYDWMDPDDPKREKIKSQIQSKIYQKQYQEQLQSQVDGILKQMQTQSYLTVSDYLNGCNTDGFIGTIFDAHGQGVPIITPINQEAMVRAVQLDSKISKGLYTRLGEDVDLLKKKITAQVSRSIATGESYAKTAQQLAGYTRIGYNNAVRIARTEGHRIQTTATMDAMHAAKDRGADVVKQWDATLDGRTRHSHAVVDGEIRELNKSFSNGLDFPGDPDGQAAEVVNCRCALLQRARWAVGDGFTKYNNFTKQLETFNSPDDYDQFKKGFFSPENKRYMNYVQQMQDKYGTQDFAKVLDKMSEREYKQYSKLLSNNPIYNTKATLAFTPAATLEEATAYAERFVSTHKTKYSGYVDYGKIDVGVANDINEVLTDIFDAYDPPPMTTIQLMNMREKKWRTSQAEAAYGFMSGDLYINGKYYKNAKTIAAHAKEYNDLLERVMPNVPGAIRQLEGKTDGLSKKKRRYYQALLDSGRSNVYTVDTKGTIIHEMGHMLDSQVFGLQNRRSTFDIKGSMEKYAGKISAYAADSPAEYVAESFSAYWKGEIDILDPELVKIFEGARKK